MVSRRRSLITVWLLAACSDSPPAGTPRPPPAPAVKEAAFQLPSVRGPLSLWQKAPRIRVERSVVVVGWPDPPEPGLRGDPSSTARMTRDEWQRVIAEASARIPMKDLSAEDTFYSKAVRTALGGLRGIQGAKHFDMPFAEWQKWRRRVNIEVDRRVPYRFVYQVLQATAFERFDAVRVALTEGAFEPLDRFSGRSRRSHWLRVRIFADRFELEGSSEVPPRVSRTGEGRGLSALRRHAAPILAHDPDTVIVGISADDDVAFGDVVRTIGALANGPKGAEPGAARRSWPAIAFERPPAFASPKFGKPPPDAEPRGTLDLAVKPAGATVTLNGHRLPMSTSEASSRLTISSLKTNKPIELVATHPGYRTARLHITQEDWRWNRVDESFLLEREIVLEPPQPTPKGD